VEAFEFLEQAQLRLDDENSVRFYAAEIYRLLGETCLRSGQNLDRAKYYFAKGLEIARAQKAKSMELRLCASICDLAEQGENADRYHSELRCIYESFSEGIDTVDLVNARARLQREGVRLATAV
jgi:hypothetical protein